MTEPLNVEQAAARLRLDRRTQERVVTLVARHGLQIEATPKVVRRWLQRLGPGLFFDLLELGRAGGLARAPRPAPGGARPGGARGAGWPEGPGGPGG